MALKRDRNNIIESALRKIGALAADEPPTAADILDGAEALDDMVKNWQASGAHLWTENDAVLFVQPGQAKYQLGGTTTDHATESFTDTTLSADAATSDTVITLTSTAGLLVADKIGIKLDSGDLHWTTIASLGPTTITDAMPSAATSGNVVYYYTTDIDKPLRVPDARRRRSGQDIEMIKMGRIDYLNLPNKFEQGTPVQFYFQPKKSFSFMYLWPTAASVETVIPFTYYRPIAVFDTSATDADFPDEWIEVLKFNLALRLAPEYGVNVPQEVAILAATLKADTGEWDQDAADVDFQFSFGRNT